MLPRHFVGLLPEFRHAAQVLISLKLGMRSVMWLKGLLPWGNMYQGLTFFTSLQFTSVASKISLSVSCFPCSHLFLSYTIGKKELYLGCEVR